MKPLRRLTNLLAACAVAAAALIQPALAAELAQDPFITDNAQRQHYEPGGKYHLFGDPRGSVSDRTGQINVIQDYTHQMGNLLIQQANINGTIGYHTRFSGHGYEEHAPFDNHAADSASKEQGNVDDGFTVYRLNWEGHEHHPADAYDGPKGGNYPKPTGARDEYTYHVNGIARSIKLNPTDTRSIRQRISDNYSNLGSNFSDRAYEANRKMFEHNAKLNRWGNSMEFINGVAAGALNPFISAGEAVDQWMQENPNAAETVEALVNVLPFAKVKNLTKAAKAAKVAKLAKAAKPGKAAVSGDFSISYKNFSTVKPKVIAKGTINGKTFRDVNQSAKIGSPDSPTLIAQRVNAKIQADGKPRPNATVANSHAEIGVIQQAYNAGETKGASMTMTVSGKDVCGYCKGDIAAAAQASGLKSLTVNATDNVTGKNKTYYWTPGMKSIKERK
ncbi:polymorphic toxin MafB class 1 [Neisseria viridiae]|uniref:polymorphic toxin MafB class 1 n=1 Tax=Neisseria viridiae TaxID=2830648 RepID=UPI00265872A4|nr:polymorphic toxin MafB class 1 [Neisseria viridiae]